MAACRFSGVPLLKAICTPSGQEGHLQPRAKERLIEEGQELHLLHSRALLWVHTERKPSMEPCRVFLWAWTGFNVQLAYFRALFGS